MEQNINWEEGWYIGKKYVEDIETVESVFDIFFYSPAVINSFEFYIFGKKIKGSCDNGFLHISFNQNISKLLAKDLQDNKSEQFVIGYIQKYLPYINNEILKQRYLFGHFLIKTYSSLDISKIIINLGENREKIIVSWPQSITGFPPVMALASSEDEIYIRDFIDAGNAYLTGDYDGCIRKSITSIENAFAFYKLKGTKKENKHGFFSFFLPRKYKFDDIVMSNIYKEDIGHKVISENILFIYKIRNKIVHDKFKIKPENGWVCKKAIGTLNYIYQSLGNGGSKTKYIMLLFQQFLMLDKFTSGVNLEMAEAPNDTKNSDYNFIKDENDLYKLDNFVFNGLKISDKEKNIILKSK